MTQESWLAVCAIATLLIAVSNLIVSLRLERMRRRLGKMIDEVSGIGAVVGDMVDTLEKSRKAFWAVISREGGRANRKPKGGTNNEERTQ